MPKRILCFLLGVGLGLGAVGYATAQSYPNRVVTLISPAAAGGTADVLCRIVADKMRTILGQQVIVENHPGAGGIIGAEFVARSARDGHVLLCAPEFVFISHLVNPTLSFDPSAFEAVSVLATFPTVLVGRADLPANNVTELIAYARDHPGKLSFASAGKGSMAHLTLEAIKVTANLDMVHIPYRGGGLAMNDLLAGQIDMFLTSLPISLPHIESGKLKLLAITSRARLAAFPQVSTLAETLPGLWADSWIAIAAPSGTSRDITQKLSDATAKALQMPDVRGRMLELQAEPFGSTPEQMRELMRQNVERWRSVITAAKINFD